jgi:hypothetical protein
MKTQHRILESIVPTQHKKVFGLKYLEEEPKFNLAPSPKKAEMPVNNEPDPLSVEPQTTTNTTPEPQDNKASAGESEWVIKKVVGMLRYAGSMSTQLRNSIPDEAYEIVDKLEKELEELAAQLEPYLLNAPEEDEETEETEEPMEEPIEEPEVEV